MANYEGMTVWYPGPRDADVFAQFAAEVAGVAEVVRDRPPSCEVLIEGRPTLDQLAAVRSGGAVIVPYVGIAAPTAEAMRTRPDLSLHNVHHNAAETAEAAMALLLAASRRIVTADAALRRGDWAPRYTPEECLALAGRTALVLGLGHIGRRIAQACLALQMEVIGVRRQPSRGEEPFEVQPIGRLAALLPRADVLVLALPQTPETEGLIGAAQLNALRKPSILVNIARAAIVEEKALYEALRDGILHAAGLDVWYCYPKHPEGLVPGYFDMPEEARATFPSQFPLHELPNLVMSPHRGGSSDRSEASRIAHLALLIRERAVHGTMGNRVDLSAGY